MTGLVFMSFTFAGIGLFITQHPGWATLCFLLALGTLLAAI